METKKLNDKDKVSRENTDSRLKVTRMEKANYNCEINHDHKTFFVFREDISI